MDSNKATTVLQKTNLSNVFFQTKAIPLALLNACDYVLHFNFKIANIAGSVNNAPASLTRLELTVTQKIRLKIGEDIKTKPIEVTTSSSDVADAERFFFTEADNKDKSQKQTPERKEQSRLNAKHWVAYEEPPSFKTSVEKVTKIDGDTTSPTMNGIKANARR